MTSSFKKAKNLEKFMDFGVAVNSFAKKEIDWQDPINPILKNNPSDQLF